MTKNLCGKREQIGQPCGGIRQFLGMLILFFFGQRLTDESVRKYVVGVLGTAANTVAVDQAQCTASQIT